MTTHFLPKWSEDVQAVSRSVRRSNAGLVPDDQFDRLVVLASLFVVGQDRADRSIETPTTASARANMVHLNGGSIFPRSAAPCRGTLSASHRPLRTSPRSPWPA